MSDLPPKSDLFQHRRLCLVLTQNGHWRMTANKGVRPLLLPHEQEVTAVVAGAANVGI
jgi:hypothetical protein